MRTPYKTEKSIMAWPIFKRITNIAAGVGKVLTAVGAGIFAVAKTSKWITNSDGNGLETPLAKGLAAGAAVAAGVTNAVIRYPNMQRERQKKKPLAMQQPDSDDDDTSSLLSDSDAEAIELANPALKTETPSAPVEHEQTCCHPGFKTTRCGTVTYVSARVLTGGYALFNGLSGYLSGFTISQFVANALNSLLPDYVSDKIDDEEWKLAIVHVFAVYLFASNFKAYVNSNLANILESYLPDLINGKWKEYGWTVYAKVLPHVAINAVNAKFSLDSTADLLNQYTLNRISSNLIMSDSFVKVFSSVGVATNVVNFSLVNIPSMHNLHSPEDHSADYIEHTPGCYRFRHPFKAAFFVDSAATGAVSSRAVSYSAHQIFDIDDQHVATKAVSLAVAGFFVTYNTYASDVDGYHKELDRRVKERTTPGLALFGTFSSSQKKQETPAVSQGDALAYQRL